MDITTLSPEQLAALSPEQLAAISAGDATGEQSAATEAKVTALPAAITLRDKDNKPFMVVEADEKYAGQIRFRDTDKDGVPKVKDDGSPRSYKRIPKTAFSQVLESPEKFAHLLA